MANPIEPLRAAMVLTPTTSPATFTSGPPEFPGLIAASVWMKSNPGAATVKGAPLRLTIPNDTLWSSPNGLPSASTNSPTRSRFESPSGSAVRPVAPSIFRSARSTRLSRPTTLPWKRLPSARRTWMALAPSITWALVTISPLGSMTKPEPVLRRGSPGSSRGASSFRVRCTRTWTSPGWSCAARSARRPLTCARSGAALAPELSRQSFPPPLVDGPAHPIARPTTARSATSERRRDPVIGILPKDVRRVYAPRRSPRRRLYRLTSRMRCGNSGIRSFSRARRHALGEPGKETMMRRAWMPSCARESMAAAPTS